MRCSKLFMVASLARRRARAASLRADVRLLDDPPPLIHLGAQKGVKLIRRRADHNDGVPFELVSDRRLCKGCDRIVVNLSNDVLRRLGRNEKCRPSRHLHSGTPATPASAMVGRSGATDN